MSFKIDKLDYYTYIKIESEKLDYHIAPSLKSELVLLAGNGEKNIVLDVERCVYCDSSGLSSILVANRLCKNANGSFILCNMKPAIERLVTVSQLDSILNIVDKIEDAEEIIKTKQ